MIPTLSEFSFGFALTNELIDIASSPLKMAPVFPTLVEEGRAGGGYDVNLDIPGFPLFIQFKRSDCMVRANTRELASGARLDIPYYRFPITARARSSQHDMLCDLDDGTNEVFYAAPRFHEVTELNDAYLTKQVADRTFYIRPREIGKFADDGAHLVAFDATRRYVFSEPRIVKAFNGSDFFSELSAKLGSGNGPLRSGKISKAIEVAERAIRDRSLSAPTSDIGASTKSEEEKQLQRLADLSLRFFGAQLFIVQPKEP